MLMMITFHPELMCIAKLVSFSSEAEQARKGEKAACTQLEIPEDKETEIQNADIPPSAPEVQ